MDAQRFKGTLENHQIGVYFGTIVAGAFFAVLVPGTTAFEIAINPVLALMLFATFLQVPLADLGRAFSHVRFLSALLTTNFLVVPLLVAVLVQFLPPDPIVRLGVLLVLLAPCIDYVVTFSHLGRADASLPWLVSRGCCRWPCSPWPVYSCVRVVDRHSSCAGSNYAGRLCQRLREA